MGNPVNELAKYNVREELTDKKEDMLVRDVVETSIAPLRPDMGVAEASEYLTKKGLTGSAVVETDGSLVGFFSTRASIKSLYNEKYNQWPSAKVSSHMSKDTHAVEMDSPISLLVEKYVDSHYHTYPVVEKGKYAGFVSIKSLLSYLLK